MINRKACISALICIGTLISTSPVALADEAATKSNISEALKDEFTKQATSYEQLFKAGNASALADLWTVNGTLATFDGRMLRGRQELKQYFERDFAKYPNRTLSVKITSLQEAAPDAVIEEGVTAVNGKDPSGRYTVLHVKGDDGWKMAWVTEDAIGGNGGIESIKELGWLVGKWKSQSKSGDDITFQAKWIEEGNFIECTTTGASHKAEVRQIIGYNPNLGTLQSWHFAPDGGIGKGHWSKISNGWKQASFGVLPNGMNTTSMYTLHLRNKDTFTWQSTERFMGGVSIPDSHVLVMNRVAE